jgi:putative ATP-dependent endonuclease of OLD family
MKLQAVHIKHFRSIEDVSLEKIGDFNVLIGKNNAGKSNILLSIDNFFDCVKDGNVVKSDPSVGKEIDFFERRTQTPIDIELSFLIGPADIEELANDIINDASQMKNAVEGIRSLRCITASMKITNAPERAVFISNLSLCRSSISLDKATNLLSVSNKAASELLEKYLKGRRSIREASFLEEILRRFDASDWERLRKEDVPQRYLRYYRDSREISDETSSKFESILRRADSYNDFRLGVESLITTAKQESEKYSNESLMNKISTFAGEETNIPQYILNLLRKIGSIKVLYLKERRNPIGEEEAKSLLSLKMQRGGTKMLQNIQDTVSSLLGVRIDAFNSDSPEKKAEMDVDDFLAEVNGSGIREALRLVLDFEFQKPDLFLVEEPEIFLHPALETSMMRYMKMISSFAQIFITTHSTNFLDTSDMKNVYLVSKPKSTQVQRLSFEEAANQIPHELGIRLSSLFLFDRLVFVEGPNDESVLREWAAKLRINLSQAGVGFVHMGGVHNFGYFAAEQTLTFLTNRRVKLWFLLDRDEKEKGEIAKLAQKCGPSASLKVLRKRELENYMIVPRVMMDFISLKRNLSNVTISEPPSEKDIMKKFDEIAEKLRPLAVAKRVVKILCKPIYPASRQMFEGDIAPDRNKIEEEITKSISELDASKAKIEQTYNEQSKAVKIAWQQDKLSVVPGDLLLDGVCQEFGVRFRKETDSSRIAALFKDSEIDNEIQQILQEIGGGS